MRSLLLSLTSASLWIISISLLRESSLIISMCLADCNSNSYFYCSSKAHYSWVSAISAFMKSMFCSNSWIRSSAFYTATASFFGFISISFYLHLNSWSAAYWVCSLRKFARRFSFVTLSVVSLANVNSSWILNVQSLITNVEFSMSPAKSASGSVTFAINSFILFLSSSV